MTTIAIARRATWWVAPVLLLAAVLLAWHLLPVKDWIQSLDSWIGQHGALGIFVFAVAYVVVVISLAPAEIMSMAAGLIFGLWGIPLVVISATIGATCAFLIARYLAREKVREFIQKRESFNAADRIVKEEGWKIVALFRLNPLVPFNLQNYFFGITEIGLRPYVITTFFGIMPGTAAYVYLGTLGHVAAMTSGVSHLETVLLGVGLLATVLLIWIVGRRAKTMLRNLGVERNGA